MVLQRTSKSGFNLHKKYQQTNSQKLPSITKNKSVSHQQNDSRCEVAQHNRFDTVDMINSFLRFHPRVIDTHLLELSSLLTEFVDANKISEDSPNLKKKNEVDEMSCIFFLMCNSRALTFTNLTLKLLQVIKILFRKAVNRSQASTLFIKTLKSAMDFPRSVDIAAEACNVVLNMCYDTSNVQKSMELEIFKPLLRFLQSPDVVLQANACGALQSICYQKDARDILVHSTAIPRLVALLQQGNKTVTARAVGALHNLSSNKSCIPAVLQTDGLSTLVKLLDFPDSAVCSSTAGTIQNISRDPESRAEIIKLGAVERLSSLLFGTDIQTQASAAGALMNIATPMNDDEPMKEISARMQLKGILSDSIALGIAYSAIFTDPESESWFE